MRDSENGSVIYSTVTGEGYEYLLKSLEQIKEDNTVTWVYRAQPSLRDLETTLERSCKSSGFNLGDPVIGIERNIVRYFRRIYDGYDQQEVERDVLYCLSLMRHHGAPTRLLDFTYSKYVAMYFALEYAFDDILTSGDKKGRCAVWCIQVSELVKKVKDCYKDTGVPKLYEWRGKRDDERNNTTFEPLYWNNEYKLVLWENPLRLHKRLHLQQGVFLCPGDVKVSFMDNLTYPYGNKKTDNIKKINCILESRDLVRGFEQLMRRNLTRESLFLGLDGLAKSMYYQCWFYEKLSKARET